MVPAGSSPDKKGEKLYLSVLGGGNVVDEALGNLFKDGRRTIVPALEASLIKRKLFLAQRGDLGRSIVIMRGTRAFGVLSCI